MLFLRRFPYPCSTLVVVAILYLSFTTIPENKLQDVPFIDKWTHIAMYFVLSSALWVEYLRSHARISYPRLLLGATLFPAVLGGLVELGQAYLTTTRSGDWLDFVANSVGVLLALLLGLAVYRRHIRCKRP